MSETRTYRIDLLSLISIVVIMLLYVISLLLYLSLVMNGQDTTTHLFLFIISAMILFTNYSRE